MNNKLIFTSFGLSTQIGRTLIGKELKDYDLTEKKIFLFNEPYYYLETMLVEVCITLGFKEQNIIFSKKKVSCEEVKDCDVFYVGEGNVFESMLLIRERGIYTAVRQAFFETERQRIYIGASAGAMVAGISIEEGLDFDRNNVNISNYEGLGLVDGIVIPHYTKAELKQYVKNSPGIERKYRRILSVANTRNVVLEI